MPRERFHKKISPFVEERLPDFVQSNHTTFVTFLTKYYEWMEQDGYPVERTSRLLSFRDVDESPEPFLSYLQGEYLNSFPTTFEADKALVIKNIKEYHKAKGTPKAFVFLFRILYAIDVEINIPWRHVIKLSTQRWQIDTTIKVSSVFGGGEWQKAVGQRISQATSGASAFLDKVRQRYDAGVLVTELYLHDITGTFDSDNRISVNFTESGITKTVYGDPLFGVVNSLTVVSGGQDYAVGDQMVFSPVCSGVGAKGYVSSVTSDGAIREVILNEFGYNYQTTPTVTVQSTSGTGASITATVGPTGTYPGYYLDNDGGYLSNGEVLQDSEYYQKFSYVIESNITDNKFVKDYKQVVKASAHPAGMKMFGRILLDETNDASQESDTITTAVTTDTIAGISSSSSSSGS